ncbi:ATP-binding cassette domain-containing protein [Rhodococcus rhodochrous]|uniref:ATP-binding cassette domain-containing protein n=1 Tax=Rhodococcus rhodochrous TaxID=1829 RepID=UPI001E35BB8E|nr:ABC transporter ATP-binding protein [Rhodococcus rhodochrous]MCD2100218.1 ABC transporter ATP-binding protein [Rhodococcus rhodochrous]MCD2124580.1 ABC transporter ATP-binding protein [Rhodococcus rhodochrous]MCQ4137590.1 ABC transporter ATP-binding protein [Rhodococcus rhodochrous]MDJ0021372.1 ABC transporter ATP-binding protein [Rhodococcus rhodochrous]
MVEVRVHDLVLSAATGERLVDEVSLQVSSGRTLALVGESGSGKSLTAGALAGLLPTGVHHTAGEILFDGEATPSPGSEAYRTRVRGRIGFVFQDPMVALNPVLTVFRQIAEAVDPDRQLRPQQRAARVWELLEQVGLPDPATVATKLPGELSGGMCQRVVIAIAIARRPDLLVADEPTTALDVTVQAQILALLDRLRDELGAALILISHDLEVVAGHADDVLVLQAGRVVEQGPVDEVIGAPRRDYTRSLVAASPRLDSPRPNRHLFTLAADDRPVDRARIAALEVSTHYRGALRPALDAVSVHALPGEAVGLVGGSGSGKSTLLSHLAGLTSPDHGRILLDGQPVWIPRRRLRPRTPAERRAAAQLRRSVQLVFQDSWGSLDPYLSIGDSVAQPLIVAGASRHDRARRIKELFDEVELPVRLATRRPHELSGGQRQRVVIARALATDPEVLLADEPVSALDVTIQARIVELLARLQRERAMTMIVVSHDLAVIRLLTSYAYVLDGGRVVEQDDTDRLVTAPTHPFTRRLVESVPGGSCLAG